MMSDMQLAASSVFSDDQLFRPTYQVKVLFIVVDIYGFGKIDRYLMYHIALYGYELWHRGITNEFWLGYKMGIDYDETWDTVNKFKDKRTLSVRIPLPTVLGTPEHLLEYLKMGDARQG